MTLDTTANVDAGNGDVQASAQASPEASTQAQAKVDEPAGDIKVGGLVVHETHDYVTETDLKRYGVVIASVEQTNGDGETEQAHTVAWLGDPVTLPATDLKAL